MRDTLLGLLLITCFVGALCSFGFTKQQDSTVPGPTFVAPPAFWRMVESHCVAVLAEAHIEKHPTILFDDRMPEMDNQGNYIVHVPEQTLKLRCK